MTRHQAPTADARGARARRADRGPRPVEPRQRRRIAVAAVAGAAGVCLYVTAWAVAGLWTPGFDPVVDAISDLFALGAPAGPARLMIVALVVTGVLLLPFAWALHHGLPGRSLAGPVAAAVGGVATVAIVAVPCTAGCPGFGASFADSAHSLLAGVGYAGLVVAPLLFAPRLVGREPGLAWFSVLVGTVATVGFVLRAFGVGSDIPGLLQRVFNTVADAWYLVAAIVVVRRMRGTPPSAPDHERGA